MKKILPVLLTFFIFLMIFYLSFLFIVPEFIDFNKYTPYLEKSLKDKTGIFINLKKMNIKTSWDLSLNANVEKTDLFKNNIKFAQINNLKIKISLIPLLIKKVRISEIEADKFFANIKPEYFTDVKSKNVKNKEAITLSDDMPNIRIKLYRISFLEGENNYTLKGKNLAVSDFVLNKKAKISSNGKVVLNNVEHINYDLKISSNILAKQPINNENNNNSFTLAQCLKNIIKYKVHCNINSDLAITGSYDTPIIKGKTGIDDLTFVCGRKKFPSSSINLNFDGSKIAIDSNLNIDKNSSVIVKGFFDNGKSKNVNLSVFSDSINMEDLYLIFKTFGESLEIDELKNIILKGNLKADFKLKSNLKKITSDGYLKITDGSVYHKVQKVLINNINTDIDFSKNNVSIKRADAKINSHPIVLSGKIDSNAFADIKIYARNILLKNLIPANNVLAKEHNINGIANLTATLKGQLKTASPSVYASIKDIKLTDKKTKLSLKILNLDINAYFDKVVKARIKLYNAYFNPDSQNSILVPNLALNLQDKDLSIEKTTMWINNIKTDLSGSILNIKNPVLNNVQVNIQNYVTVPLKNYQGSKLTLKGDLRLNGNVKKPKIEGSVTIPSVYIPSLSLKIKDAELKALDKIVLSCPTVNIADSNLALIAEINPDLSKALIVKHVNIHSDYLNLDRVQNSLKKEKIDNLNIADGKINVKTLKTNNIQAQNINCNLSARNSILNLKNITSTVFTGNVIGNINYDINKRKTYAKLQGRDLSANLAIPAVTNHKDDVRGKLHFDAVLNFVGNSEKEIRRTISGNSKFEISNGKMGMLGKLEHLLYAQNIVADSILKASLNLTTRALMTKNTGVYKYLRGDILLNNGVADIKYIKSTGPSMSLYMNGKLYLSDNLAIMNIFGRISNDIVNVLGPIGDFSMEKAISSIFKFQIKNDVKKYITETEYENYLQIPHLSPRTEFKTREFRVVINGDLYKQSSVKSFEWLAKPEDMDTEILKSPKQQAESEKQNLPDFVKRLPDYKK